LAILGIDRAAYHGGGLNGKNVQQMFQESDAIFLQFQELLLGVDEEDGRCNNEEVIDIIRQYSELCTLFDYLFSMARTPTGELLTGGIQDETRQCLHETMIKWRDLWLSMKMPKIRGLEDHFIASMEQWNGIGDFLEDLIEQVHRFAMKEEKQTANRRNRVRAENSNSKWEWVDKMSSAVRISKEVVKEKTSQKRKAGNKQPLREQRESEKRRKRMETRRACLNNEGSTLEPDPIEDLLVRNTLEYMDMATSRITFTTASLKLGLAELWPRRLQ
jgi:hypothetical protein